MEPAHGVQELLVLVRLATRIELDLRDIINQPSHVCLEALGRLSRHLETSLQDADRKLRVRRRGKPQTEGCVRLTAGHGLDNLVQLAEPRLHEVAIGKEHPMPLDDARVDELDCVRRLALAKGDRLEDGALGVRKL